MNHLFRNHSLWIGLDLGTANIRMTDASGRIFADKGMRFSSPDHRTPLAGGVIHDPDAVIRILIPLLNKVKKGLWRNLCVLAFAPSDATESERELLRDCLKAAGAAQVYILNEVVAAAIGSKLDLSSPYAQMMVDIGHGVTDIMIFKDARILHQDALRIGCHDIQQAVQTELKERYGWELSEFEAERLVQKAGLARLSEMDLQVLLQNSARADMTCAEQRSLAASIQNAIWGKTFQIVEFIRSFFIGLPPEVSAEVIESGVCLSGGGSCMSHLDQAITAHLQVSVQKTPMPLYAVIFGAEQILKTIYSKGSAVLG